MSKMCQFANPFHMLRRTAKSRTINIITVGPLSDLDLSLWYSSSDKEFPTRSHSHTYFLPSPLKSFLSLSWLGQLNQSFVKNQKVKRIKILFKRVTHYSRGFFLPDLWGSKIHCIRTSTMASLCSQKRHWEVDQEPLSISKYLFPSLWKSQKNL